MPNVYKHDGVTWIEWSFRDDKERKLYLDTRRPVAREMSLFLIIVAVGMTILVLLVRESTVWNMATNLALTTVFALLEMIRRRSSRLLGLHLSFRKDRIDVIEYIKWFGERPKQVVSLRKKYIVGARWDIDGLLFLGKFLFNYKVVLSYRILGDEGLGVAEEWCTRNGITIDGVKPLPGSYERPVAHPRGL